MVPVERARFYLFTCKYDSVETRFPPELHEVDHVPKPEGGVPSEHHAWLAEITAEVSVEAGVVLQLVGLNELRDVEKRRRAVSLCRQREAPHRRGEGAEGN